MIVTRQIGSDPAMRTIQITIPAMIGIVVGAVMAFVLYSLLVQNGIMQFSVYEGYYPLFLLSAFLGIHGLTCGIIAGRFGFKTIRGAILGSVVLFAWIFVIVLSYSLYGAILDPPKAWHPEDLSFGELLLRMFAGLVFMSWIFVAGLAIPSIVNGAIIGFVNGRIINRKNPSLT